MLYQLSTFICTHSLTYLTYHCLPTRKHASVSIHAFLPFSDIGQPFMKFSSHLVERQSSSSLDKSRHTLLPTLRIMSNHWKSKFLETASRTKKTLAKLSLLTLSTILRNVSYLSWTANQECIAALKRRGV